MNFLKFRSILLGLMLHSPVILATEEDLKALVKELAGQVNQLSARVIELEQQLKPGKKENESTPPKQAVASGRGTSASSTGRDQSQTITSAVESKPVTIGDVKGSYKIPGTNTSLAIGGYAKLDTIYNSTSVGGDGGSNAGDQLLLPSQIPFRRTGEHSQITFHPRESRFWLKSFTPTVWGDLNTYLEMDFFAVQASGIERFNNSHSPGLRHVFGSLGHFLAGQTWSTFMNVAALPELNDFGGPVGRVFMRQPLIRWTEPFQWAGINSEIQFALESPESALFDVNNCDTTRCVLRTPDDDQAPDIVARLNFNPSWGTLSLAGLGRQIRIAERNHEQEAWGGALSLQGRVKIPGESDNLNFMLSYGNGLGRYVSNSSFPDGALNRTGRLDLITSYSGYLAYQHFWNSQWRSTVAYGVNEVDNPSFLPGIVSKRVQSAHINLLWSPLLQTTFGLEYIYALRELKNGDEGHLHRVQFSTRYNF
jgi:hypothetical protein